MKTKELRLRNFVIFVCVILAQMIVTQSLFSQSQKMVFPDWLSTTGSQNFFHKGLTKTDASGNVYIVGSTINGSGNNDIMAVKYNSSGVQQWLRQYNGGNNLEDAGSGCYVDGSGNVYVSGMTQTSATNSDIILIKYNSSGTQQWIRTYNGTGNSFDSGSDMYVDASGNVYITGSGYNASGNTDVITLKYNSSGTQQWVKYLNYNGNNDVGVKIAPYGTNVLVAVIAQYNTNSYYYGLLQYAMSNGTLTNSAITGSSTTNMDVISDMVVDASGYIYISGSSPIAGQGYDYSLIKLNVNLGVAWERNYNGNDDLNDYAKGLRVDASGNVYVTGYSETDITGKDIVTLKYNSSGTLQWTESYNNELNGDDEAYAMAMDNSGKVYVTGYTSTEIDQFDVFTIKYDASGNEVWKINSDGPYHLNDKATNIAIDSNGDIVIAAASETAPGQYQYLTVKYVEKDIIIPTDFNDEDPNSNFLYYKNSGQIIDTDGDPVSDINYYNKNFIPEFYFQSRSHSMVFAKIDTSSTTDDTLHRIDVTFPKGNVTAKTYSMDQKKEFNNYYLGHCPEGISHVYGNQKLVVTNIFDNIDLIYSSNQNGMKYYFVVKPGGDPGDIEMVFTGADAINIDATTNDLTIQSSVGNLVYERPTAYQVDQNNDIVAITGWNCAWQSVNATCKDFFTGSYNTSLPLIIQVDMGNMQQVQELDGSDWSTYFGNQSNVGTSQVNDAKYFSGNLYVTGKAYGSDFPVLNGFQLTNSTNSCDAFISQFNSSNYNLIYSTYIGGNYSDEGATVDVNNQDILISGFSQSYPFPVYPLSNPNNGTFWQNNNAGIHILGFMARLNKLDGTRKWVTCFGGAGTTKIFSGKLDENSNIYVTGCTNDILVAECVNGNPVINAFPLKQYGSAYYQDVRQLNSSTTDDAFIAKFSYDNHILWSTLFGGNDHDASKEIAINNNTFYIAGVTSSYPDVDMCAASDNGFPLCNSGGYFQNTKAGLKDGFFAEFDLLGNLQHSSYLGGLSDDCINDISFNSNGDVYLLGLTQSISDPDFTLNTPPTSKKIRIFDPNNTAKRNINNNSGSGATDLFLYRLNENNELIWSTFIGGSSNEVYYTIDYLYVFDISCDVFVDSYNNVFITGKTGSYDCGIKYLSGSVNIPYWSVDEVYLISYNSTNQHTYSTYIGGLSNDEPNCITGKNQNLYIGGKTWSNNYPTNQYLTNPNSFFLTDKTPAINDFDGFITNIKYSNTINIPENYLIEKLMVSPNPCTNQLYVSFSEDNIINWNINIYDISGRIVYSKTFIGRDITINTSKMDRGSYVIECVDGNKILRTKFIVN